MYRMWGEVFLSSRQILRTCSPSCPSTSASVAGRAEESDERGACRWRIREWSGPHEAARYQVVREIQYRSHSFIWIVDSI